MVFFNHVAKQMAAKIVYYGPAFGGKTTNLQYIHAKTPENMRGEMVSLETESDRTIFFDLLPILYGDFQGYQTRFLLYTVPGQVYYNNTRKLVLQGADGIVFVADSQLMKENVESLKNLQENLAEMDIEIGRIPLVFQYNKRDLKNIHSVAELQKAINPGKRPYFEATALYGPGVFETLKGLSNLTLDGLKGKLEGVGRKGAAAAVMAPGPRPAVAEKVADKGDRSERADKTEKSDKTEKKPLRPVPAPAPAEATPAAAIAVDFAHEPQDAKGGGKAQVTQVEYTKRILSKAEDIDRELDRLRRATIQKSPADKESTQELPPASVARAQERAAAAAAAEAANDGPRVLVLPISTKDAGKVQSVKLHVILEGDKLSAEYKKAFRVSVPQGPKALKGGQKDDGKGAEIGFMLDVRIKPGT